MHLFIINDAVSRKKNSMGNKGAVNNVPITESTFLSPKCRKMDRQVERRKEAKENLFLLIPPS